jgi:hypothetical protein
VVDVCILAQRDHEDLDLGLRAMVEPATPPRELQNLLDIVRLGLAIHLVAEARVHDSLLALVRPPPVLRLQLARLREEHRAQQRAVDALTSMAPGSCAWYTAALELRVLVLDHARREDYLRPALEDHVATPLRRRLAAEYATERMRLLASTSPLELARSVQAA